MLLLKSDGSHPHLINIQFARRASVSCLSFYMDYSLDESYTPKKISVKAGMTHHDLTEVRLVELSEPVGWVTIPLFGAPDPLDVLILQHDESNNISSKNAPLRAHFIQISIISMHQNGRDTHVRQVKVYGPRRGGHNTSWMMQHYHVLPEFQTVEMTQYAAIR